MVAVEGIPYEPGPHCNAITGLSFLLRNGFVDETSHTTGRSPRKRNIAVVDNDEGQPKWSPSLRLLDLFQVVNDQGTLTNQKSKGIGTLDNSLQRRAPAYNSRQ
jgi:hypothetical protein